jgi:hypothetical protein
MTAEPEPQPTNESWINPPNESRIKRHMALSTVIAVILLSILAGVVQAILEDYGDDSAGQDDRPERQHRQVRY